MPKRRLSPFLFILLTCLVGSSVGLCLKLLASPVSYILPTDVNSKSTPKRIDYWIGDSQKIASLVLSNKRFLSESTSSTQNLITSLSRFFLGKPYTAFSLDKNSSEVLVLNLMSFDCFLFVEQVLSLSHSRSVDQFVGFVKNLRYENGQVSYCRRHHYFTSWAQSAITDHWITDLASSLPGHTERKIRLNYMTSHFSSYTPLKNLDNLKCLVAKEKSLVVNQTFIPLASINKIQNLLRGGDIFGLVTRVKGLDVTHVGFIEVNSKSIDILHAVPNSGVIRSKNLLRYVKSVPDVIGISLYRPQNTTI